MTDGSNASNGLNGSTRGVLDDVRDWFARYILTIDDDDLDILTLWAAHTHVVEQTYSTPRLILDSPVPGSGKTTVLEHLGRLCLQPLQAASLSSPSLLTRMLNNAMRTVLIDEVDRTLNPKKEGVDELLAVINSGYKKGATRPVLVPTKEGWDAVEMPTYSPIAMAGNAPNLPDDTRSRCIRVLLLPDHEGVIEPSDWEEIEEDAQALGLHLSAWAEGVREHVRVVRPDLPERCVARVKERWAPLARVASAAGGRWPDAAWHLIERDIAEADADREDGAVTTPTPVQLLKDIYALWPSDRTFMETRTLLPAVIAHNPEMWGEYSTYGKALTVQRMGRMLVRAFKINSAQQPDGDRARGYLRTAFAPAWRRLGITPRPEPCGPFEPTEPSVTTHAV